MKLTDDEKRMLEGLRNHSGMDVVKKICERMEADLARHILIHVDLSTEDGRKELERMKIYNEARNDFVIKLTTIGASIYSPDDL